MPKVLNWIHIRRIARPAKQRDVLLPEERKDPFRQFQILVFNLVRNEQNCSFYAEVKVFLYWFFHHRFLIQRYKF